MIDRLVVAAAKEASTGSPMFAHHVRDGNVVVFTASDDPDAGQLATLGRIHRLVAYLRSH